MKGCYLSCFEIAFALVVITHAALVGIVCNLMIVPYHDERIRGVNSLKLGI